MKIRKGHNHHKIMFVKVAEPRADGYHEWIGRNTYANEPMYFHESDYINIVTFMTSEFPGIKFDTSKTRFVPESPDHPGDAFGMYYEVNIRFEDEADESYFLMKSNDMEILI